MNKIISLLLGITLLVGCSVKENKTVKLGEELLKSEFQSKVNNDLVQGLSDASIVGINKDKYENERLYGSEGLQVSVILNGSDFGMNGTDKKDDTLAFNAMLAEAKTHQGLVKLVLPSGDLDFIESINPLDRANGIVIKDISNLIISGHNTNIYFHGEMRGFLIENSSNIYFEDFSIDYGVPPFSIGNIISNDGTTFVIQVHAGYQINGDSRISAMLEYNQNSFTPRARGNDIYGSVKSTRYLGDNKLEITFNSKYATAPINTLVVLRHYLYEYDCFYVHKSSNVHFESVTVYSALGMGVRSEESENIYFNRLNFQLKPHTDRLMTVTADALHFIDVAGEIKITNSLFENNGDDAVNEHGMFFEVKEIINSKTLRLVNPRGYNFAPRVTDTIEISSSFDLTVIQELTVASVVEANPGFIVTFIEDISSSVEINNVGADVTRSATLLFENNLVRNKRCRGVLVQTRGAIIRNNTFANMDAGVFLATDANEWYESITPQDVLIENNKFLKNNYVSGGTQGDITITPFGKGYNFGEVGTVKNISILNNFFGNSANSAIFATSTSGLNISHNLIYNVGLLPKNSSWNAGIILQLCDEITLNSNAVYANSTADFTSIKLGSGVNPDNITINNNLGFTREDLTGEVIKVLFNLPHINQELSLNSNSLDDWDFIPNSLEIVGISDVDQQQLEANDLTFKINKLKVAYSDNGLYVGYDVFDDELVFNHTVSTWEGDGVEIFMTDDLSSKDPLSVLKLSNNSCLQLFMSSDATYGNQVSELRTSSLVLAQKSLIQMSFTEKNNGKGYFGKAFIPFSVIPDIKQSILSGGEFSFVINFSDSDSNSLRVQYASVPHPVEFNKFVPYKMSKLSKEVA
ncbi:MAG: hypothetical protein LBM99_04615 [Bacillales bacterium]|jgi:hypothetical protein|nr:hypothetical protein [Bacillales bacterium]